MLNAFNIDGSSSSVVEFQCVVNQYLDNDDDLSSLDCDSSNYTSSDKGTDLEDIESSKVERHYQAIVSDKTYTATSVDRASTATSSTHELDTDRQLVEKFQSEGCGCASKCYKQFTHDVFLSSRLECLDLNSYGNDHINQLQYTKGYF